MKGGDLLTPRGKANTERVNVFLSKEALQKLQTEADQKGTSISGLVRMIVLEHLDKQ
jgi:hypothetical protein